MKDLILFNHEEFGEVRSLTVVDGSIWFVGVDVARALGYTNPQKAVRDHCKGVNETFIPSAGGKQRTNVITEGDVYRLIIRSKLPAAERFERWVFEEVLPSIRKHGIYATDNIIEQILNNPDFGIKLLITLKEERQKRMETEKKNAILMHVNKTYTTTEIAKELGFKSAEVLNNDLREKGIQFKQNKTWVLYSKYANCGYTEIKQEVLDSGHVIYYTRWTQLGRDFILNLYKDRIAERVD